MLENLDAERLLQGPLGEYLEQSKEERAAVARKSNRRFMVLAAVFVPVFVGVFVQGIADTPFVFFVAILLLFGGIAWAGWPRWKATQAVKIRINEAIAESIGITYRHQDQPGAAYQRLFLHKMLPSHNRRKFEDFWEGDVAGNHFRLYEAHLEQHTTDSKGRSKTTTKFRGPFLEIGFGEEFTGTTILRRAGTNKRFGFFGGRKEEIEAAGKALAAIDMVHPEFEDAFEVYSTDKVEAHRLVHPRYVERLIEIERAFKGKGLSALFCEGDVTVMLRSNNMFESGTLNASKDREKLDTTVGQFRSLANLAIALNEN